MNTRTSEAIFNNPLLTEAVKKIAQISMRELSESICADLDEALQVHKHLCAIEQSYEEAFKSLSPRELSPGRILEGLLSDDAEIMADALTDLRAILKVS